MSSFIDQKGRVWPADSPRLTAYIDRLTGNADHIVAAVRWLGLIYLEPVGRSLVVAFRPQLVTSAAIAGTFGSILRYGSDRIVLSYGRSAGPPEIYADVDRAILRMEQIVEASRLPALRSGIIADRRPLDDVTKVADGRAAELLRAWASAPTDRSPELLGRLKAAGLLAQALVVRTAPRTDSFIIEHWGSKRSLLGRGWARDARGREMREQPYPKLTEWVVETFRATLDSREPRLDDVRATVVTPQGSIHRRHYLRLLVPFRSSAGDTVSAVINLYRES